MVGRLALCTVLASCAMAFAAMSADEPSIDVEFYYSKKDSRLAEIVATLDSVVKELPAIKIERISIDEKKGYGKLSKIEKKLEIQEPGEATVVFGPFYLVDKGDKHDIEMYFGAMMHRLTEQMKGKSDFKDRLKTDPDAYAKELFGADATAAPDQFGKGDFIHYYRVMKDNQAIGWIADAYDPIGCPICSGAQFITATDKNLAVIDLRPVIGIERLATKMPEADVTKFIAQLKGRTPANPPEKVDAISRATKTSKAYQTLLNEILEEIKKRTK